MIWSINIFPLFIAAFLLLSTANGEWDDWGSWGSCSRTCGGGYEFRTRTCLDNQTECSCPGNDTEYRRCNTDDCVYSGSTCRNDSVCVTCDAYNTKGKILFSNGSWENGCDWDYNEIVYDVSSTLKTQCNDRYNCCIDVDDNLHNCYSDYYQIVYNLTTYVTSYTCNFVQTCYRTATANLSQTVRTREICGILYWGYKCRIPQWSLWSTWAACSSETQTRSRTCEHAATTSDGHALSCDGDSSETRDCDPCAVFADNSSSSMVSENLPLVLLAYVCLTLLTTIGKNLC